jgi:hypothetical protein
MHFAFTFDLAMSEVFHERYGNLQLVVNDLIATLHWANVSANRSMRKTVLQDRWGKFLYDGGPPPLATREDFVGFPSTVPVAWQAWHQEHLTWSNHAPLLLHVPDQDSEQLSQRSAVSAQDKAKESYYAFDKRALRMRRYLAVGTVRKEFTANEVDGNLLAQFPKTLAMALDFSRTPRAKVVLWMTWISLKQTVSGETCSK